MLRPALSWAALLVAGLAACGSSAVDVPDPPRPANLADFDPRVVQRIEDYLARLAAAPRSAQAWSELGLVYASERLKTMAVDCFAVAERLEPRQPKWPYRSAVTLAQLGSYPEAIAAFGRSLALEPGYPPSHARQGDCWLSLGELEKAEQAYRRASELDSSYPGGSVGLAKVALQRDRTAEAIALLEPLLRADPDDRTFRQLYATATRQAGSAQAEDLLGENDIPVWNDPWELEARAFRQKPGMIEAARLIEQGKPEAAIALLESERARGLEPGKNALTYATALIRLNKKKEALAELERALLNQPENGTALLMQANVLDDLGEVEGAVAVLEKITTLQPSFGGAFAAKATKLARLGRHEAAVAAFARALELVIADYDLRFAYAQSLISLKRWAEARALLEALVNERAEHGDAWVQLALVLNRLGASANCDAALARARAAGNATPRLLADVERAVQAARERHAKREAEDAEEGAGG